MNLNESTKQVLLTLLSSSDTSSDEELSDLLTILEEELRHQRSKRTLSRQRKRRRLHHQLLSASSNAELNISELQTKNSNAATRAKSTPALRVENKVSTALNGIKDEILIAYLENWQQINSEEFLKLFHMHKSSFGKILQCFESYEHKTEKSMETIKQTKRSKMLLIFLLYAVHQISLKTLSYKIKIYRSTLKVYIDFLIDYLLCFAATKVCLPKSESEKLANADEFYRIAGLNNIIGCIEKLHFRFATRDNSTRKHTNSFAIILACDARGRFLTYDAATLDSTLAQVCEHNYCFLGSRKFCLREWTIIPCEANDDKTQSHVEQQLFNEKFLKTYAVLQMGVGQLQQRFRQLLCIDTHRVTFARRFLHACFGLHNFLMDCNDQWLDEERVENEAEQPIIVDAMMGTEMKTELDRFSCPRGLEKRERMIYETCILGAVEQQEINVE